MRQRPFLATILGAVLLWGCASIHSREKSPPPLPLPPARDATMERTIAQAIVIPGYAGHFVENGVLNVGFTSRGTLQSRALARTGKVRLFEVQHDIAELQAAFDWTWQNLQKADYGPLAVWIEKRANAIAVGTAHEITGSAPDVRCRALTPLPGRVPINRVPILDRRDCA